MYYDKHIIMSYTDNTSLEPAAEVKLPGTVKFYKRHLFVCTNSANWPARIETDADFTQALFEDLIQRGAVFPHQVKLTACVDSAMGKGYDLLIFPDGLRYKGVQKSDIPDLVEKHLEKNKICFHIPFEKFSAHHLFVCVHGSRDARCGTCGPELIRQFACELDRHNLTDSVQLMPSSHVGGHRFAGNVLLYPGGDWYGNVTPQDVPEIVERHILGQKILWRLWRGRMGLSLEQQLDLAQNA